MWSDMHRGYDELVIQPIEIDGRGARVGRRRVAGKVFRHVVTEIRSTVNGGVTDEGGG